MLLKYNKFRQERFVSMREQLLKVAATLTVHARQIKVNLGAAANKWWPILLEALYRPQTE